MLAQKKRFPIAASASSMYLQAHSFTRALFPCTPVARWAYEPHCEISPQLQCASVYTVLASCEKMNCVGSLTPHDQQPTGTKKRFLSRNLKFIWNCISFLIGNFYFCNPVFLNIYNYKIESKNYSIAPFFKPNSFKDTIGFFLFLWGGGIHVVVFT